MKQKTKAFVKQYGQKTQAKFLAEIQLPHLLIPKDPETNQLPYLTGPIPLHRNVLNVWEDIQRISPVGSTAFSSMITIGRSPNNDISLPFEFISKFHAFFRRQEGIWTLTDASTNGTWLDRVKLKKTKPTPLGPMHRITVAQGVSLLWMTPAYLYTFIQHYKKVYGEKCGV